jgi:hypothetical protein
VADERAPALRDAVVALRPGRRILLDGGMALTLAALRADPNLDPLRPSVPGSPSAPLQVVALDALTERFRLQIIHRSRGGWVVMKLERR